MANIKKIQDEIADYEALLKDPSVPQDEKDFAKEEIADLKKQLEKETSKPAKTKKKPGPKAPSEKKKYKASTYLYKGKSIKELSEADCDELRKELAERREKHLKSSKKSKSKPVIDKISGNVATAVKQAIDNVPADDIDKTEIKKFERIEKAAMAFIAEMKSILGQDYNKSAVQDEFKQIEDLIEKLRKKYAK